VKAAPPGAAYPPYETPKIAIRRGPRFPRLPPFHSVGQVLLHREGRLAIAGVKVVPAVADRAAIVGLKHRIAAIRK
jgi:hypothetical protein